MWGRSARTSIIFVSSCAPSGLDVQSTRFTSWWFRIPTQTQILGDSSGGSGEALCALRWWVRGVVCGGGCSEPPTFICLGDLGSGAALRLFGVHGAVVLPRWEAWHGGGSFGVVRWGPLLTLANAWPGFGRSTIVCTWSEDDSGIVSWWLLSLQRIAAAVLHGSGWLT